MDQNYPKLVADTVSELPITRQAEVYHFAQFIKSTASQRSTHTARRSVKRQSVFDLFGTVKSTVTDGSINHDKYLYD
jgi:hypothetical protein